MAELQEWNVSTADPVPSDLVQHYAGYWEVPSSAALYWLQVCQVHRMYAIAFAVPWISSNVYGTLLFASSAGAKIAEAKLKDEYPTLHGGQGPWIQFEVWWIPRSLYCCVASFNTAAYEWVGYQADAWPRIFRPDAWSRSIPIFDGEVYDGFRRLLLSLTRIGIL